MKVFFADGTTQSFAGEWSFVVEGEWLVASNGVTKVVLSARSVKYVER